MYTGTPEYPRTLFVCKPLCWRKEIIVGLTFVSHQAREDAIMGYIMELGLVMVSWIYFTLIYAFILPFTKMFFGLYIYQDYEGLQ